MVFSDVAENLCTWLTITLSASEYFLIASGTGLLMSLLSLLKWVGLAGVCWLSLWRGRSRT